MKTIRLAALGLVLAASGSAALAAERKPLPPGAQRCISRMQSDSTVVLENGEGLLYRSGNKTWINRFRGGSCPGHRDQFSTVISEYATGEPCEGDHVRFLNPPERIPGPVCILGPFEPYKEPPKGR